MCLDKYLRYVSIKGMVQKIQIRQLTATRTMGTDNNAIARHHQLTIFYVSTASGMGLDLLQVHDAHSVVRGSDKHWERVKGMTSLRETENYIILLLNLRHLYNFRD